ncbi:PQQ-like beta-propeller repeat protein [Croceicoccus sp. Ery5]|jgi:outer membrane protein assembly factor BamB|uniref:outer membrane protein assembly factor BamB family protein n=1 Tax=Croceicoccus sp. Ery5 TaxID=1703340 RepID=UPI001E5CBDE4|nr:PQQ-like beta-propeller repeat protein [Croceicoccus sp. Ery5]
MNNPLGKGAVMGAARIALVAALAGGLAACGAFKGDGPETTPTIGKREPILSRIENAAEVDPSLASVPVVLPAPTANAEWAQAGGSASKAYGHLALAANPTRAWSRSISGASQQSRLAASPVVGGGKLFAFGTDGTVSAFDATTGAPVWQKSLKVSGDGASAVFGGGASYENGRLYVTTGVGEVAALNAEDGAEYWKVQPSGPLRGAPTLAFGNVFVMTQDNQIFALDATTGEVEWNRAGSSGLSGVFGVAAPAAGAGTVIAGYSSGELIAYRYENGTELWGDALARTNISTSVGSLTDVDADPIIDGGRVYALGQGGRMAAYELLSGRRIWDLSLAGISTPAVAGDWIFVLTDDARLLAIARATGKVRWISQLQRWKDEKDKKGEIFWSGPVLAGGKLYVASTRGALVAVDAAEGTQANVAQLDDGVSLNPIVAGNTLYVLDNGGAISAFR